MDADGAGRHSLRSLSVPEPVEGEKNDCGNDNKCGDDSSHSESNCDSTFRHDACCLGFDGANMGEYPRDGEGEEEGQCHHYHSLKLLSHPANLRIG